MLQSIRENAQGIFVWTIVGLIIITFALFGLSSYLSGASKVVAASVNGVEISQTDLEQAYRNYQERLMQMFGERYRPEMFNEEQLKAELLQGMILRELLNQKLADEGYHASAQQVLDRIHAYEAFQEEGKFSASKYKKVLALRGMSSDAFESDLNREITSLQLRSGISNTEFVTTQEKNALQMLLNQQRDIGYLTIKAAAFQDQVKPTDEEIKKLYEQNMDSYRTAEKVQVEYVELKLDDVASRQEVTDAMIQQHYDAFKDNYKTTDDEAAKKQLEDILAKIKKGANFAEMAKKYSQDPGSAKQGGDLGFFSKGVMDKAFEDASFSLKKGELSKVVKSQFGYHIIQLEEIKAGDPEERRVRHILIKPQQKIKPLAEVKDAIRKELKYQQAEKIFYDDADKLNNLSYEMPDSLQPVADQLALQIKESPLMTRRGGPGVLSNPKVITAAFSSEVINSGKNSELIELSDTHLMVLRLKQHMPSAVKPLDEVKTQIRQQLVQQQAGTKVNEVVQQLLQRLRNGETPEQLSKAYADSKWLKTGFIGRNSEAKSTVPMSVRNKAFAMPKPEAGKASWDSVQLNDGDQALVAVYAVQQGNAKPDDKFTKQYVSALGNADYDGILQLMKSQADITISQPKE